MAESNSGAPPSLSEIVRSVEPGLVCILTPTGNGSGFVVDDAGNVITNAHVVEHYADVTLEFVDGSVSVGVVVGKNWGLDLACVRLTDIVDLVPLSMGDSDSVQVGEDVLAMGYPLNDIIGGSPTVTRGIISAKRPDSLQTDAAINPGNSGGPLIDARGRVIGVNTSVIDSAAGRNIDGIGFAIPINDVKSQLEALASGGASRESQAGADPDHESETVPKPMPERERLTVEELWAIECERQRREWHNAQPPEEPMPWFQALYNLDLLDPELYELASTRSLK